MPKIAFLTFAVPQAFLAKNWSKDAGLGFMGMYHIQPLERNETITFDISSGWIFLVYGIYPPTYCTLFSRDIFRVECGAVRALGAVAQKNPPAVPPVRSAPYWSSSGCREAWLGMVMTTPWALPGFGSSVLFSAWVSMYFLCPWLF